MGQKIGESESKSRLHVNHQPTDDGCSLMMVWEFGDV